MVQDAHAVYIASPRLPDLWPGRSLRVERTLKGEPRHNLRAGIYDGLVGYLLASEDACEGRPLPGPYVITVTESGGVRELGYCTEYLATDEAVAEAIAVLGEGQRMPWRPDPFWVLSWLPIVGAVPAAVIAWRRWRTSPVEERP